MRMRNLKSFIVLISITIIFLKYTFSQECPSIARYLNILPQYYIKSFLKLQKTNLLVINTISDSIQGSSVVYYIDISVNPGVVITTIRPDFLIIQMEYMFSQNSILVANNNKIIIANPYTLQSQSNAALNQIVDFFQVQDTTYIVVTLAYNQIVVLDSLNLKTVKILDNTSFLNKKGVLQLSSQLFTLSFNQNAIICSDQQGLYVWIVNFENQVFAYNDYIKDTMNSSFNKFEKHPQYDILMVGGQNKVLFIQMLDQKYITLKIADLGSSSSIVESIIYQKINSQDNIIIGDTHSIFIYSFSVNSANANYGIESFNQEYKILQKNHFDGYKLLELPIIVYASNSQVTFFNYQNKSLNYNLYFTSDYINKNFVFQNSTKQEDLFLIINQNNLVVYQKNNLGSQYQLQKQALKTSVLQQQNSFYRVKNCGNCFFIKTSDNSNKNYIVFTSFEDINSPSYEYDIGQTQDHLDWSQINQNLDPFIYNQQLYVAFSLPKQTALPQGQDNYYFNLLQFPTDLSSLKEIRLSTNQNKNKASLTIFDTKYNILYGIDQVGNVYKFDIQKLELISSSISINNCLNAYIGDIFIQDSFQFLIIGCQSNEIIAYDLENNSQSSFTKLTVSPLVLQVFNDSSIIVIGDVDRGSAKIFKLNTAQHSFDLLIEIFSSKGVDILLSVDLLKDSTLLLQFKNGNIFFEFNSCLQDIKNCLACNQNYYFKIQDGLDSNQSYGQGKQGVEFITSQSFLTAVLKAQIYKNLVRQIASLNVNMYVDKSNPFALNPGLLIFDFSNIISLSMQCTNCQSGEYFSLQSSDQLVLQNFYQINLNEVSVNFINLSYGESCGLTIQNIQQSSNINYIQIKSTSNYGQNCNQILINNSTITISNYQVTNQDFSKHKSIINISKSAEITLSYFSLSQCTLGRSFSILSQIDDVKLNLNSVLISGNLCAQIGQDDSIVSSLFIASLFSVTNFNLTDNDICNTVVFTTAASIKQSNQVFDFNQVEVSGNTFITKTAYILFNALYSMISKPAHQVVFNNLMVSNNKLNITNIQTDQQISSLIYTTKISNVIFTNTSIVNQTYIFLSIVDTSNKVEITNFNCTNELAYNKDIPFTRRTAGCLYFIEVSNLNITTLNIINKQTIDENLIRFESYFTKSISISINYATFINNNQSQLAGNAPMNPIYIMIMYNAVINVLNSNFTQNNYQIKEKSHDKYIVSTNGIGAHFLTGSLNIKNCKFKNSTSNAAYNYIYVQGDSINMESSVFLQSSFSYVVMPKAFIFKNYGGNLYLQVKSIQFTKCWFSQSTAIQGSFIYAQPFSSILEMIITDCVFNEGYASNNGGAIYLYPSNTIQFNCDNCTFTNIYTINVGTSAATIGLENSASLDSSRHSFNFNGGTINNIYGNGDNNFIYLIKVDLQINDFYTITTEQFKSLYNELVLKARTLNRGLQPAQLVNIQDSTFQMTNSNLQNWSQLRNSYSPLLIQITRSQMNITNSTFTSSKFKNQVIKITEGSSVFFDQVNFTDFSQIGYSRFLQQLIAKQPQAVANSLILITDSKFSLKNTSLFQNINCTSNCNGSSLQLLNTSFTIQNTTFQKSNSYFGGAIFVSGFIGENQIGSCNFNQNTANYDAGSLYLNAGDVDVFNLTIDSSSFTENVSTNGKGGAIYIYSNSQNTLNQNITIQNSKIQQNQGMVGGALSSQNIAPNITNNQISNNRALIYGNNQISYPTELGFQDLENFLKENKNSTYVDGLLTIKNFRSGDKIPTIALQFKNDESIIHPLQESEVSMYSISIDVFKASQNVQYDLVGSLVSAYDKDTKSFVFPDVQAVGTPETSQYFEFKSNNIKILDPITYTYVSNYSLKIKIEFRSCQAGEEIQKYKQLTECSPCPENTFSLDLNGCKPCPDGANCNGGTSIIVKSGYWRSSLSSSKIIKCDNALSNCLEGTHGNQICYEGHIGALCEECDIQGQFWLQKFAKSGDFSCTNCNKITGNLYIVILMTIWTMISMTIAIRGDIDTLENAAGALTIKRNIEKNGSSMIEKRPTHASMTNKKSFGNNQEDEQRAGTYVKMLTNYLQIVNTLASFNLTLPSGIYNAPEAVGRPLQQSMNSLDCALAEIKTDVPIIYLRVMFSLLIPVIYLLLFFIGILLAQIFNKGKPFPWYIFSTGIMFLIIYVQPDLVSQVISLLSCRKIGDEEYILGNVSYLCGDEQHRQYSYFFLVPVLIFWIFLIPLILCLLLWRKADSLDTLQVKLKYGFLYKEYQRWYWEFVKMAEKIAIILVLNFFYSNVPVKGLISFQIIVIYGLLAQRFNPYKEEFINKLDVYSTNCSAASILIGVFIYDNSYTYLVIIGFIMLIILNAWYIISLVIKILSGYIYKIKEIKKLIIEKLADKIDYFKKYLPKQEQQRKMNPEVRDKIRKIFNKFIKLPPAEKKAVILKIYEDQLTEFNNKEYDKVKKKINQFIQRESQILNQKAFSETTVLRKSDKTEMQQKALDVQNIKFDQITGLKEEKNIELILFEPDNSQESVPKKTETSPVFQKKVSMQKMVESDQTPKMFQESPFNGFEGQQNPEINQLIKIDCQKMQSSDLNLIQKIN